MIWKAWLKGHEFDLFELEQLFRCGDTRAVKDGDEYYLMSVEIDNRPAQEQFYEAAARVLDLVNGVGQANSSSFRPVALTGRYREGDHAHQVVVAGRAEARSHAYAAAVGSVMRSDGKEVPPPLPPGPLRVGKALRHPDAAEALRIMGKPEPTTWVDLYKVYEIVREAVKPVRLEDSDLATKDELSAFTASANRPDVGGPDARHARMAGGPPKRSMHIPEARAFIGRVLGSWLDSL